MPTKIFPYHAQPLKTLYLTYATLSILVRLPIWVVTSLIPAFRPRPSWTFKRTFVMKLVKAASVATFQVGIGPAPRDPTKIINESGSEKEKGMCIVDPIDWEEAVVEPLKGMAEINEVKPVKIVGYWLDKDGARREPVARASVGETVILFIHGGGHVGGSGALDLDNNNIAPILMERTAPVVTYVFTPEYRLCQAEPYGAQNPFPANLLDVLAAYRHLLRIGFEPANIVVSGLSSGAHLAIDLVLYVVQSKIPSLPVPGGLLSFSPGVDWANTHDDPTNPECSMVRNDPTDMVVPVLRSGYSTLALRGSLPESEVETNVYLSPASLKLPKAKGHFTGFPKTMQVVGDAEAALDSMRTFKDRLVEDVGLGWMRHVEYRDANHIFLTTPLFEPERSQALEDVKAWLAEEVFVKGETTV